MNKSVDSNKKKKKKSHIFMQNVPAGPEKTKQNISQISVKFESTHQLKYLASIRKYLWMNDDHEKSLTMG